MVDVITNSIIKKLISRAEVGKEKYGTTVADRADLNIIEWLTHLEEELMDAIVYIQKIKQEIQ